MNVEFRIAAKSDRLGVRNFIAESWSADHIYVKDESFFKYDFELFSHLQFVLAERNGVIIGLVGFIQYNEKLEKSDLFLVILRVLDEYFDKGIGYRLLDFCKSIVSDGAIHTVGLAHTAEPLYKLAGFKTGPLEHYYWVNPKIYEPRIVGRSSPPRTFLVPTLKKNNVLKSINKCTFHKANQLYSPKKTWEFFQHRYLNHPYFKYEIYFIVEDDECGICVSRTFRHQDALVTKVIDFIGDDLFFGELGKYVISEAASHDVEYVDVYSYGLPREAILTAGFLPNDGYDIVPNYFSPFRRENITLLYATTSEGKVRVLRGDGDQDRPSLRSE